MTILIDRNSPRAAAKVEAKFFYFYMALSCMAVAFLGFAPTYWMPMARGSLSSPPVVHLHGLLFFAWTLYFVFQSWLAASGRIARHRSVGLIGISLATAMTMMGIVASISVMKRSAAIGQLSEGLAFAIVPLSGILFFAVVFALAIICLRDRETHKRLMLLASISILDAAVARWFLTFLAPPGPVGPPPVPVTIAPALVAYLLLVVAIVFDWRTRGRPHPVYIYGGLALVAVKLLNWPISTSAAWHSVAGGILALAQ
ncbi:hypothetical protein QA639_38085 [Bradyrhizobium pachyrhizi]|uniref:hypothetical protein n=1 Tax=Bradyrhizobium pachyrhizi TaxID=280333 RepID=UPI000423284A|nr:hypothetical protein [Bradyrhizobium pachyrhizi]WFU55295.1 hypothetical protein QA639_38085 [Bradyrhizobium pachyrhizi]